MGTSQSIDFTIVSLVGEDIFSKHVDTCQLADTIGMVAKDESFHLSGLSASILTKDGDLAGPHTIDLEVSVGSGEYPLTKQIVYEI